MATGISLSAPDKALHTSSEKANFQRLARLLMCGGLTLLREVFDSIHPPTNLPAVLSHPATARQLNGARLTRAERDCIYLPSGGYGTSSDFDITLLFRLLRTICNLTPPLTGWDCLPPTTDLSRESDLVRIKFYRNAIYGHSQTMEISDDEFVDLWREISEALLRIAGSFSSAKRDEWKESIDKFLLDPLTPDAERSAEALQSWYKTDLDTKDEMLRLRNAMETWNKNDRDTKDEVEKLTNEVKQMKIKDEQRSVILKEQMNIMQEQLNLKQEQTNTMLQKMINIVINLESFQATGASISPSHLLNEPQMHEAGQRYDVQSEREERECVVPITMEQTQAEGTAGQSAGAQLQTNQQDLDFWYVLYSFKEPIRLLVRYLKFKLGVDIQGNKLGSLVITVSCSSLQVLERLWDDYCSNHLNEVVQQTLVTAEVLKELGVSEVKLKTTISEEEYEACKEFLMQSSGKIYSVVGIALIIL